MHIYEIINKEIHTSKLCFFDTKFSVVVGLMVGSCLFPRLPHKALSLQLRLQSCGWAQDSCIWKRTCQKMYMF